MSKIYLIKILSTIIFIGLVSISSTYYYETIQQNGESMFKKDLYPPSKPYRTENLRIVPGFMGFLQAQEEWRIDYYNQFNGMNNGFVLKWKNVGSLPNRISENIYSYLQPYEKADQEDSYRRKWRLLINWLGSVGVRDPVPQSPAENARFHRIIKHELKKQQELQDERPTDD